MVAFVNSQLTLDEVRSGRTRDGAQYAAEGLQFTYYFNVEPAAESTWPACMSAALMANGFASDEFGVGATVVALHLKHDDQLHSKLRDLHRAALEANEAHYAAQHPVEAADRLAEMARMDRVMAVKRLMAEDSATPMV